LVDVQEFGAAAPGGEGKKFKLDPQRLMYSLQWKHNATPPDFELVVLRKPEHWFGGVANLLLEDSSATIRGCARCSPQRGDPRWRSQCGQP
jgi:hypothetical protein